MSKVYGINENKDCVTRNASEFAGSGGKSNVNAAAVYIRAAVGDAAQPRCMNYRDDVISIQQALNRFPTIDGGPEPKLTVDGLCGPKTKAAIHRFQTKWGIFLKGTQVTDGIVDVDGRTIKRLREGPGAVVNPTGEFHSKVPRIMQIVTAAIASLTSAKFALLSNTSLFAKNDLDRADRHFKVTKTANPARRIEEIQQIYQYMQTAVGYIPQGLTIAQNDPPESARGYFMYTFAGGYWDRNPANKTADGIVKDRIYICPKGRTLKDDDFIYVFIHELAHYVSTVALPVVDHAYYARDEKKYLGLDSESAYATADCYSQFAFDAVGKRFYKV